MGGIVIMHLTYTPLTLYNKIIMCMSSFIDFCKTYKISIDDKYINVYYMHKIKALVWANSQLLSIEAKNIVFFLFAVL